MSKKLSIQYVQDSVDLSDSELARLAPIISAQWSKQFAGDQPTAQELRSLSVWLEMTNVLPQESVVSDFVQAVADNQDMTIAFATQNPNGIIESIQANSGGIRVNGIDIATRPIGKADLADRFQGLVNGGSDSGSDSGSDTTHVTSKSTGNVGVVGGILIYTAIAAIVLIPVAVVGGVIYGGTKLVKKAAED